MPMLPTTARGVAALPTPAAGRVEYNDKTIPGLQLRITANGARSWSLRYRVPGAANAERATIAATELAEVRKEALALRAAVKVNGANPQAARRAEKTAPTFGQVVEGYLAWAANRMDASSLRTRTSELKRPLAAWANRPIASLVRRDVLQLLEAIASETDKGVRSNRVRSALSAVWVRALDLELVQHNVIRDVKPRTIEEPKDKVLSDAEIAQLWAATATGSDVDQALRLMLLTGQRPTEIAGLVAAELHDLDTDTAARIELPAARMKAGKPHITPLVGQALAIVRERAGAERAVFVSRRGNQVTQAVLAERMRSLRLGATPHDLRRTCATGMSKLGIAGEDRRAVLAHVAGDVHAKHYDQHDRQAEKRRALAAWGRRVLEVVQTPSTRSTVVQLAAAGRKA